MTLITPLSAETREKLDNYIAQIENLELPEIDISEKYFHNEISPNWQGIALLKWCRVKGINKHIILRSPTSLIEILTDSPKNAIAASKGVSLIGINDALPTGHLPEAKPTHLREIFKMEFDLKDIKHDEANVFGVRRLYESHSKVEKSSIPTTDLEKRFLSFVFRYIYSNNVSYLPPNNKINEIKKSLEKIRSQKAVVVYVDDRAKEGWANFLKIILGCRCGLDQIDAGCNYKFHTIIPTKKDYESTIFDKIKKLKIDPKSRHLFIFDLKLNSAEKKITDYSTLISYKTVNLIRTRDKRYKIMYLTASNDLSKFRKLLENKRNSPHVVYTKEGADQLLTDKESFDHYLELLKMLREFFYEQDPRKIVDSIQIINLIEQAQREILAKEFEECCKTADFSRSFEQFIPFDEILFDTNVALGEKTKDFLEFLVLLKNKILVPATVKHELFKMSKSGEEKPINSIKAAFYLKCFDDLNLRIQNTLTFDEKRIINRNLKPPQDFADEHLIRYSKNKSKQTLILSDDNKVVNNCSDVTVERKINFKPKPVPVKNTPSLSPADFEIKNISITKTGLWNFSNSIGSEIKLSIKKADLPGWELSKLKTVLIGKTVNASWTAQQLLDFLSKAE